MWLIVFLGIFLHIILKHKQYKHVEMLRQGDDSLEKLSVGHRRLGTVQAAVGLWWVEADWSYQEPAFSPLRTQWVELKTKVREEFTVTRRSLLRPSLRRILRFQLWCWLYAHWTGHCWVLVSRIVEVMPPACWDDRHHRGQAGNFHI